MKKKALWVLCIAAGLCACVWAADWPSTGGNPQRDGWAQGETVLSKQNIADKKIQLLYSYKFDNQAKGLANQRLNAALRATDHRSSNRK